MFIEGVEKGDGLFVSSVLVLCDCKKLCNKQPHKETKYHLNTW